jgi:hypothetical protein
LLLLSRNLTSNGFTDLDISEVARSMLDGILFVTGMEPGAFPILGNDATPAPTGSGNGGGTGNTPALPHHVDYPPEVKYTKMFLISDVRFLCGQIHPPASLPRHLILLRYGASTCISCWLQFQSLLLVSSWFSPASAGLLTRSRLF